MKDNKEIKRAIKKVSDVIANSNYRVYATFAGKMEKTAFSWLEGGTKFHFLFENKQGQEMVFVCKKTRRMYVVNTKTINKVMGIKGVNSFPFSGQEF